MNHENIVLPFQVIPNHTREPASDCVFRENKGLRWIWFPPKDMPVGSTSAKPAIAPGMFCSAFLASSANFHEAEVWRT
jgi:hypothetical protein